MIGTVHATARFFFANIRVSLICGLWQTDHLFFALNVLIGETQQRGKSKTLYFEPQTLNFFQPMQPFHRCFRLVHRSSKFTVF